MKKRISNTYRFKFVQKSFVPYSIKGFAYVTKDCSDFFTFIESLTESVININKLIYGWVTWDEARLQGGYDLMITKEIKQMFKHNFLKNFAGST